VGHESITNLLQLVLNGNRLVKDNENRFLNELSSLGVGDGLFDRCKTNKAVSAGSTEDHTLEAILLLGGNNSGDGRETHIEITSLVISKKSIVAVSVVSVGGDFGDSKARCIGHEETASLLQNLLQFNLFVVLYSELFRVAIELLELTLVSLKFNFDGFEELFLLACGRENERVLITCGGEFKVETVTLAREETELTLELVATFYVGYVTALERSEVRVEISKLDYSEPSKISEAIMSGILVDNQGDILHRFRTEPARHGGGGFASQRR